MGNTTTRKGMLERWGGKRNEKKGEKEEVKGTEGDMRPEEKGRERY